MPVGRQAGAAKGPPGRGEAGFRAGRKFGPVGRGRGRTEGEAQRDDGMVTVALSPSAAAGPPGRLPIRRGVGGSGHIPRFETDIALAGSGPMTTGGGFADRRVFVEAEAGLREDRRHRGPLLRCLPEFFQPRRRASPRSPGIGSQSGVAGGSVPKASRRRTHASKRGHSARIVGNPIRLATVCPWPALL